MNINWCAENKKSHSIHQLMLTKLCTYFEKGTYNEKKDKIFKISSYVKLVERNFSDLDAEIILEPGRYLVGESGILLSKVVRLKKGEKKT